MSNILNQPTIATPFTYQLIIDHQLLVNAHLLHLPGGGACFHIPMSNPLRGGALPLEAASNCLWYTVGVAARTGMLVLDFS